MEHKKEAILIEILQHQVPCSKEHARHILEKHKYNIVSALSELNEQLEQKREYVEEVIHVKGENLKSTIYRLLKKSNLVQLSILRDGKVLLSIPVTLTFVIFYLYPFLTTLTMAFLIKKDFSIRVLKIK